MSIARMYHNVAADLDCAPELVGKIAKELKLRKKDDVKAAVSAHLSREAKVDEPSAETPASDDQPKKERKAGLTLSQRRALLRLLDEGTIVPASAFKALPFVYLTEVGLARPIGEGYALTDAGSTRAQEINPGYRTWAAGETVAGDPTRPPAGTKRVVEAGKLV